MIFKSVYIEGSFFVMKGEKMKKSILFGCVAASALCVAVSVSAAPVVPTADEVKTAFASYLGTGSQVGALFNADQVTVTPSGNDFDVALPAVQNDKLNLPARTIRLTRAGEFNNQAQYKVDSAFEMLKDIITGLLPNSTLTADSAEMETIWVPAYNLVSKSSSNIQGLKLSTSGSPEMPVAGTFTIAQAVSDSLIRPVSDTKMDASSSTDIKDFQIAVDNVIVEVPSVSQENTTTGADISADPITRMLSSSRDAMNFAVPNVYIKMTGAAEPVGSFSIAGAASFEGDKGHFEMNIGQISAPVLAMFAPAALVPTEIAYNVDILNIDRDILSDLVKQGQDGTYTDEDVPLLKRAVDSNAVIQLNYLGAKNDLAGISLNGTIRLKLDNPDEVTELKDFETHLEPIVKAALTITNLDKISPEPTVDQAQCDRAKAQVAAIDMTAEDAETQKAVAERIEAQACAAHGGPLDELRPFIDPAKRVTSADGTTTDVIDLEYDNNTLTVNGNVLYQKD